MANEGMLAKQHRLDSLAWLIKGNSPCGAVCFDGEELLVAKNDNHEHDFISDLFKLLADIGEKSDKLMDKQKGSKKYIKAERQLKTFYREGRENLLNEAIKHSQREGYKISKERLSTCLKKVTRSMRKAYLDPTSESAFDREIAECIRDGGVKFIKLEQAKNVHAEMKILNYLFAKNKIKKGEVDYIGISKKCCRNCEKAIMAVNAVKGSNIRNVIAYRGQHRNSYRSDIPPFLEKYENTLIKEKFLELLELRTLKEAFHFEEDADNQNKEDHSRSSEHRSSDSWQVDRAYQKYRMFTPAERERRPTARRENNSSWEIVGRKGPKHG